MSASTMDESTWIHRIALSMLKGIGPVHARNLVAYCGGVDPIFTDRKLKNTLEKVPGIGAKLIASITDRKVLAAAEKELAYVRKHKLRMQFYLDADFPQRLKHAEDAPVLLFAKGNGDLGAARMVSIVGTRTPTEQGKRLCVELVEGLKDAGATIVSGLAYGIDIVAHRAAMKSGLPTIACVAHGLDKLYPGEHAATAKEMLKEGAVVSELPSGSTFAPGNFPARNRIIAGLSDCTIVVESGPKGGSLITADIANSYDREVLAFPGRPTDARSEGCNKLIQQNKAALVTSAKDVLTRMEWLPTAKKKAPVQGALFSDLLPEEQALVAVLKAHGKMGIDDLCHHSKLPQNRASSLLLNLEFNGVVRSLPGKVYALN
ncbi:MAG: DNA-protecting protein DprA [Flavobacteriales bacterium]|nr:DNA-protecting protein DprA [Flavobacteriales bacterium]MBK7085005.1 DNA-protecting protein DprA [Flavobacteriales bacterium]MBK7269712.1 DNA-protecting protein DprA [Flavobacteriales bacterium]MBK7752550.1 DNA-protecting protein DprA [Flavobacteriales bacterium]MBK9076780.1 DNA-protecting protein DprA [Flavobacteriales bacterium]